jgi:phosphoribosylaminoimidazolecarboxamide formyltransferase / IMP cyclohydrolase
LKKIQSALISVFYKDHLETVIELLKQQNVTIYSTGGTQQFIEKLGGKVEPVEELTSYPSILGGRVKTLHPKVFGGILARREEATDLDQLVQYDIPQIDLVIVDLYPFEETVQKVLSPDSYRDGEDLGEAEAEIVEKIDIGGVSLIRAAAKNFKDVVIVASKDDYEPLTKILSGQNGATTIEQRRNFAAKAFNITSHYDTKIFHYFNQKENIASFKQSFPSGKTLRYGENPHQQAVYYGNLNELFDILNGKELSYNNLVDVDAAVNLVAEFAAHAFVVIKHTNACGVAVRPTVLQAWKDAFAADTVSAFGGILATNGTVDAETAAAISEIFFEVLIAPNYTDDALKILTAKKNRIILKQKQILQQGKQFKTLLNGVIEQDNDWKSETESDLKTVTKIAPTKEQIADLLFANKCVKHLKSNTIILAKNGQMLSMGCGQTSRVDALKQAIDKAGRFGFDLNGAVMASDAFFPFPDCVEIADQSGIKAVIHPGGSIKDQDSVNYCDAHGMAMVMTGFRHFRH